MQLLTLNANHSFISWQRTLRLLFSTTILNFSQNNLVRLSRWKKERKKEKKILLIRANYNFHILVSYFKNFDSSLLIITIKFTNDGRWLILRLSKIMPNLDFHVLILLQLADTYVRNYVCICMCARARVCLYACCICTVKNNA